MTSHCILFREGTTMHYELQEGTIMHYRSFLLFREGTIMHYELQEKCIIVPSLRAESKAKRSRHFL
jgi:hypothetical protein